MASSLITSLNDLAKLAPAIGQEGVEVLRRSLGEMYTELDEQVKREDFHELRDVVLTLAEAQQRTEKRVEELAEAQKRTEERLEALTARVEELAEAQKRTEERLEALTARVDALTARVDALAARVEELAEAQRRTEKRLDELTARVDALTARVEELAQAQRNTERELASLTKVVGRIQVELGGLARNAGFLLEDRAYISLPFLLKQRHGVEVLGPLNRVFLPGTKERRLEVNIWGPARRQDGTEIQIVGEAKTQLSEKHIREFERQTALVRAAALVQRPYLYLLVTSQAEPEVAEAVEKRGWLLFFSYELEEARDDRLLEKLQKLLTR